MGERSRVGVVVGRFQVDGLTVGHCELLDHVYSNHDRMLVLIGVRPAEQSDTNPLAFADRHAMIQGAYPNAVVVPISDTSSDYVWSNNVDALIQSVYGYGVSAVFHVGRDSFSNSYHGRYFIEEHEFGESESGTQRRNEIRSLVLTGDEQRLGAIHSVMNQPHRITMMVDMMMIRRSDALGLNFDILVGKKRDEDLWRLPGGRVEPDESFREAAAREMLEETNLITMAGVKGWNYVGDFSVPDWRCRDTDRITYRTVLFVTEYTHGSIQAGDDLAQVAWVDGDSFADIVPEHEHLLTAGLNYFTVNPPSFALTGATP